MRSPSVGPPSGRSTDPMVEQLEQLEVFRSQVRDWLTEHIPTGWRERMTGASERDYVQFQHEWLGTLREGGYAAPHWPAEWGGGFALAEQIVIYQECGRMDAPRPALFYVALNHAAATMLHAANEEQRRQHLPAILHGEVWCQGFSEPNAGSDLASLQTRAVRDGDSYVVNGQKIWSSGARYAQWCLLLARTDPDAPKRKGISYFMVDLATEGIEVRPIRQLTGGAEFCEIFFTDAVVPVSNRLGPENEGWGIAQSTLSAERGLTMVEHAERISAAFTQMMALSTTERDGRVPFHDPAVRRKLATLRAEIDVLQQMVTNLVESLLQRGGVGVEASVLKIYFSELSRRFADVALEILGPVSQEVGPPIFGTGVQSGNWMNDWLSSWGWTIGGGTNEVLRTQIAERALGLPREPAVA